MLRRISTPLDIYYFRIVINNTVKFYLWKVSELPGARSEIAVKVDVKLCCRDNSLFHCVRC